MLGFVATLLAVVLCGAAAWLVYRHTADVQLSNLRQRLTAIVSTAALQFRDPELLQLQEREDYHRPAYERAVRGLLDIRASNPEVRFAYILRITGSGTVFVADSESLNPDGPPVDDDGDGDLDDYVWPGYVYEEAPVEAEQGQYQTATSDIYSDQWGTYISGYAPIRLSGGTLLGVLAADIQIDDVLKESRQTLVPFLALIGLLTVVILLLSLLLLTLWRGNVRQLVELDRQKDEVLNLVSHQLVTPITVLRYTLENLLEGIVGDMSAPVRSELKGMQVQAENLVELGELLIDVTRLGLGRFRIDPKPVNLQELLAEVKKTSIVRAEQQGVTVVSEWKNVEGTVNLDRRYGRMILENLLSNAIKYSPKGSTVRWQTEIAEGKLTITIQDHGAGIPPQEQTQIFRKGFRASNVRTKVDGTGFGLFIVKGAVEAHGGHIAFTSEEGKGTTFRVELPAN